MKKLFFIMAAVLLVAAGANAVVFQEGLDGYSGTRDTSIIGADGYTDKSAGGGGSVDLYTTPTGGGKRAGFIGFDDIFGSGAGQFDSADTIQSATLKIYVFSTQPTGNDKVELHPMLTPWAEGDGAFWTETEGASSYNHRYYHADGNYAAGDFWGTGGVIENGPVDDVDCIGLWGDHPLKSLATEAAFAAAGSWMEFDVTDVVKAWQDGTIANNGWYLYANDYWNRLEFYSSEYVDDPSLRPILEIVKEEPLIISVPEDTAIFKQGYNDYFGSRDTSIIGADAEKSAGGAESVDLYTVPNGGGKRTGFIGFDNLFGNSAGQIPQDAVVKNAKLRIYVMSTQPTGDDRVDLHPMLKPWAEGDGAFWTETEGASSYNHRYYHSDGIYDPNDFWGSEGAIENGPVANVDFPGLWDNHELKYLSCTVDFAEPGNWMEFDVTGVVEAWQNGTIDNNGWYLYANDWWNRLEFWSSEYSPDPSLRPELVVEYTPFACGHPEVPYPALDISGPDGARDCYVDIYDFKAFVSQWLECTDPAGEDCNPAPVAHVIPSGSITVDGNFDDWNGATWINLDQVYYGTPADISEAKMALKWNAETDKVYAAIKVLDTEHIIDDAPFSWDSHDHIEVYSQGDITVGNTYDIAVCDLAQQYVVGIGSTADYEYAFLGSDWFGTPDEFEYACSIDGDWLNYEVAVPQYSNYGGVSGDETTSIELSNGDVIRFDVTVFSRYTNPSDYGFKAENTMPEKFQYASSFREYQLVSSGCGEWGYLEGDFNQDCKVDVKDFAELADKWLYCTDPENPDECDLTWRD